MIISAQKKLRGFTLIELLIVIAIMGILAAAVLVAINPIRRSQQARDASRKSDIGQFASALQAYYVTPGNAVYPTNVSGAADTALTALTAAGDLKRLPKDPKGNSYSYTSSGNVTPNDAAVFASLEAPTAATGWWCWRASNGVAAEVTNSSLCTAP